SSSAKASTTGAMPTWRRSTRERGGETRPGPSIAPFYGARADEQVAFCPLPKAIRHPAPPPTVLHPPGSSPLFHHAGVFCRGFLGHRSGGADRLRHGFVVGRRRGRPAPPATGRVSPFARSEPGPPGGRRAPAPSEAPGQSARPPGPALGDDDGGAHPH